MRGELEGRDCRREELLLLHPAEKDEQGARVCPACSIELTAYSCPARQPNTRRVTQKEGPSAWRTCRPRRHGLALRRRKPISAMTGRSGKFATGRFGCSVPVHGRGGKLMECPVSAAESPSRTKRSVCRQCSRDLRAGPAEIEIGKPEPPWRSWTGSSRELGGTGSITQHASPGTVRFNFVAAAHAVARMSLRPSLMLLRGLHVIVTNLLDVSAV
jgi:hypothetical protein